MTCDMDSTQGTPPPVVAYRKGGINEPEKHAGLAAFALCVVGRRSPCSVVLPSW